MCCYHRFDHSYQTEDHNRFAFVATTSYKVDQNWYVYIDATGHLTSDLDRLTIKECYKVGDQVQVANGSGLSIYHISHSVIASNFGSSLHLKNILHVPQVSKHLLSVQKFAYDNNIFFEFHLTYFLVKDRAMMKVMVHVKSEGGLYLLPCAQKARFAFPTIKLTKEEWHRRLGHPASAVIHIIFESSNLDSPNKEFFCL